MYRPDDGEYSCQHQEPQSGPFRFLIACWCCHLVVARLASHAVVARLACHPVVALLCRHGRAAHDGPHRRRSCQCGSPTCAANSQCAPCWGSPSAGPCLARGLGVRMVIVVLLAALVVLLGEGCGVEIW